MTVTQAHIDAGRRLDFRRCPIRLALDEAQIRVEHTRIPHDAVAFMRRFDAGLSVQPFTCEWDTTRVHDPDMERDC